MHNQIRATVLEVLEDVMMEIDELEHTMMATLPNGTEEEALQSLRRMIIERIQEGNITS